MPTEADTCRQYVTPKLYAAGWTDDQIAEQRHFTAGRLIVQGNRANRRPAKRADYLLRLTRDMTLAVVEAKASHKNPADGLQQAKDYAQILGLKFAYSTNGQGIVEFDFITGKETARDDFPAPSELWKRQCGAAGVEESEKSERLLTPYNLTAGKEPRYYQEIAINSAVQSFVSGEKRALLTLATGIRLMWERDSTSCEFPIT
jgi:type I restriction enzyme R subunit